MRRDYYAVLGVSIGAGQRELRQAYRRLARQYSPDVNLWDVEAGGLFDEISEAYRILSDPGARSLYDRFGHRVFRRPAGEAQGERGGGGCGPAGRSLARAGGGGGRGEGHAGPFGGPRGDLIVITRVAEHPFFIRKGDNVHCEVPVTLGEVVLGARIRVPTLDGETALVLPPGTQSGQVFRLRGKGMRRLHGEGTGDLYVTVRVSIPRGLDARTQGIFRELERLLPETPRAGCERFRGGAA